MLCRVQVADTSQNQLCESGLHGRIVCKEATTDEEQQEEEEENCLGQETQRMDNRSVEICTGLRSPNFRFLVPTAVPL